MLSSVPCNMVICANSCSGVTCKNTVVGFLKIVMSSAATLVINRSFRASYISRIFLLIFAFLSHADCCAVVAAVGSGINSARIGLAAIVTILGRSSGCSVVTVFPPNNLTTYRVLSQLQPNQF